MHRIWTTPEPSLCCYGDIASEPQRESTRFFGRAPQSARFADRVILLPADACSVRARHIPPTSCCGYRGFNSRRLNGLQRDRRHGNAMPSPEAYVFAHHTDPRAPPRQLIIQLEQILTGPQTWSRPGDANHQQSCASRYLIR